MAGHGRLAQWRMTDVTKLVQWSTDPLTLDDNDFQITYSHVLYQDRDGAPGTAYAAPVGLAALDVRKHIYDQIMETTPEATAAPAAVRADGRGIQP